MLSSLIKTKVATLTKVAGVEIFIAPDNSFTINFCVLERRKGIIHILNKEDGVTNIVQLNEHLDPGVPIALCFTGKAIIHKKVATEEPGEHSSLNLLKTAFPAIVPNDFYVQKFTTSSSVFFSIIRKETIYSLLQPFETAGYSILSVSLGYFNVNNVLGFLTDKTETRYSIYLKNTSLLVSQQQIEEYTGQPGEPDLEVVNIGGDTLETKWLPAYANGLSLMLANNVNPYLVIDQVESNKSEWEQRKVFKLTVWASLLFFLSVFCVNFFLFNQFSFQNKVLQQEVVNQSSQIKSIQKLKKEAQENKFFLNNTGWLRSTKNSFYADRLAATIPKSIQLTEMNINPLDPKLSMTEKKAVFIKSVIHITGICSSPQLLNTWLKDINQLPWVTEIKEQNYIYDNTLKVGKFNFIIGLKEN